MRAQASQLDQASSGMQFEEDYGVDIPSKRSLSGNQPSADVAGTADYSPRAEMDEEDEDGCLASSDSACEPGSPQVNMQGLDVQEQRLPAAAIENQGLIYTVQAVDSEAGDSTGISLPQQGDGVGLLPPSAALETLSLLSRPHSPQPENLHAPQQSLKHQDVVGASDPDEVAWRAHNKHFLVLTASGKPVFTHHGDADALAGLMALITALVSVVQSQGDTMQHLARGSLLVVVVNRGPILLVAASKCGETVPVLQKQLDLLYRQVLLVVTTGVERILLRNPAYDVRSLLDGVGSVLSSLIRRMAHDASYLLPGTQPVVLPAPDQSAISAVLAEAVRTSGAHYGILMVTGGWVVAAERGAAPGPAGKGLPLLDASDLLLLDNFVQCHPAIRLQHGEAFCPLCLPAYNPATFLHTYLHFLYPDNLEEPSGGSPAQDDGSSAGSQGPAVYLALLAPTSDTFHALSAARQTLEAAVKASGLLNRLHTSLHQHSSAWLHIDRLPNTAGGGRFGCTPLWHFMARFGPRKQVVRAWFGEPFHTPLAQRQLALSYGRLYSMAHDYPPGSRPNKLVWLCTEQQVLLAVLDSEVELYLVLDPLCDKSTAIRCTEQLRRHLLGRTVQSGFVRATA